MKSEAEELARELNQRIDSLVRMLLPQGRRQGREWRAGSLAGEKGTSLVVWLWGLRQGHWKEWNGELHGDALDLVAQIECYGNMREAMKWARDWLGKPERRRERTRPAPTQAEADEDQERRRKNALAIWLNAKPITCGDVVWRYFEGRGIDLEHLARVPDVLRFHPALWNQESRHSWPAMVALITDAQGRNCAVHRTWLEERNLAFEDGPKVRKAPLEDPKRTIGSFWGGYIRLWRGSDNRPWNKIKPGETLLVSEGIEDLLSYLQFEPQWRAACAVSLSFMAVVDLPPEFTEIRILGQRDPRMTPDGKTVQLSPARRLLGKVIRRFEGEGRKVFLWTPPTYAKDINDYIQQRKVMAEGVRNARRQG